MDPKATIEEREIDVCLLYKYYMQAQEHKQKETVFTQKEFPTLFQLFFRLRHYQNLFFLVYTQKQYLIIIESKKSVQER